jgi:hypothetical protein
MRKNELISQRFVPRGVRPITDGPAPRTTSDTLHDFRQRLAALEKHNGLKPPAPEKPKPLPPPMGRPADIPRTTRLVSTEQDRAIAARRAGRAEVMRQHNIAGRFFAAPRDPDVRVPRASPTGSVV